MTEENAGKLQIRDCVMKTLRLVIVSNGAYCLQMTSVVSRSTSGRGKDGKKEIIGEDHCRGTGFFFCFGVHAAMRCARRA